jgi:hypothetical protein
MSPKLSALAEQLLAFPTCINFHIVIGPCLNLDFDLDEDLNLGSLCPYCLVERLTQTGPMGCCISCSFRLLPHLYLETWGKSGPSSFSTLTFFRAFQITVTHKVILH